MKTFIDDLVYEMFWILLLWKVVIKLAKNLLISVILIIMLNFHCHLAIIDCEDFCILKIFHNVYTMFCKKEKDISIKRTMIIWIRHISLHLYDESFNSKRIFLFLFFYLYLLYFILSYCNFWLRVLGLILFFCFMYKIDTDLLYIHWILYSVSIYYFMLLISFYCCISRSLFNFN